MGASNDGTKVILAGDGIGPCGAKRAIAAAPDGADIMYFFYRAYWDTFSAEPSSVNYGWDHTFAFGLSFDGEYPNDVNTPAFARFFGIGATQSNFDPTYAVDGGGTGVSFLHFGAAKFETGGNTNVTTTVYFPGTLSTSAGRSNIIFVGFPANPTIGLTFTGVWKIQRDLANAHYLNVTCGVNFESLSEANISNARTSANTIWSMPFQVSNNYNFFPRKSPMKFPTTLVMRNPDGVVGRKFIYDHGKVEYWGFTPAP